MRVLLMSAVAACVLGSAQAQEIHIVHCFAGGCPTGAPATNDLVVREIYALSNNDDTKFADWVAYQVTSETIGSSADMNRGWETDRFLEEDETVEAGSGARDDYQRANREHGYERGHAAPLAAFAGTNYWRETNIYSNITPQLGDLNRNAWRHLETAVRDLAYAKRRVWVVTGPLYDGDPMPELPNAGEPHTVPTGYWKVIMDENRVASAFIMDQRIPSTDSYCDHKATIAEIETRSGLELFPRATAAQGRSLDDELGCSTP